MLRDNVYIPIIDLDEGAKILSGDKKLALEVLDELSKDIPLYEDEFIKAMVSHNEKQLEFVSEKFHGCMLYCAAPRLRKAAANLDNAVHNHYSSLVIMDLFVKLINEMLFFRMQYPDKTR